MHPDAWDYTFRNIAKMLVMREVDHLPDTRHFGEKAECFLRPEVVECLHDVVADEGNRAARPGELVMAR